MLKIEKEAQEFAKHLGFDPKTDDCKIQKSHTVRESHEKLRHLQANILSKAYIRDLAKPCANCKVPIQKDGG